MKGMFHPSVTNTIQATEVPANRTKPTKLPDPKDYTGSAHPRQSLLAVGLASLQSSLGNSPECATAPLEPVCIDLDQGTHLKC